MRDIEPRTTKSECIIKTYSIFQEIYETLTSVLGVQHKTYTYK